MAGFQKATKLQAKGRIALDGPSGAGKTWTGLVTATALAAGGKVAVIDSERGSASKYADRFDFDVLTIDGNYHPKHYIEGIRQAIAGGYDALLIDSLTHAWAGSGGVLEVVDAAKSQFGGNQYMAWSVGTPLWQSLIDAMLGAPLHVIATMRSKSKFVEQTDERGKKSYQRQGTEPVARDGLEFEFDVVGDLDLAHTMTVSKTRAGDRLKAVYREPGPEFGEAVLAWLTDGAVDTRSLAKELAATAGDTEALKAALAKAKITMEDLADEKRLAKARDIAKKVADDRAAAEKAESEATAPEAPAAAAEGDDEVIPEEDRRRMLGVGAEYGFSKDDVNDIVLDVTGQRSTTKVKVGELDKVLDCIREIGFPAARTTREPVAPAWTAFV